jgi:uncharacterized surface protein with fasciclin (FAS1) repeats
MLTLSVGEWIMNKFRSLLISLSLVISFATPNLTHASVGGLSVYVCPSSITASANVDNSMDPAPYVQWSSSTAIGTVGQVIQTNNSDGTRSYVYFSQKQFSVGDTVHITATIEGSQVATAAQVASDCYSLGSVRGTAFEDVNANGMRDANEPTTTAASWKLTDGGNWYICGYAGDDASYGPTVTPGVYYLVPIAQPGWRATTPTRRAIVQGLGYASTGNDIGFVRDARSGGDQCGSYTPSLPVSSAAAPSVATTPAPAVNPVQTSGSKISGTLGGYSIFNSFLAAARDAGMLSYLDQVNGITVFAPTDAAFSQLPAGALDAIKQNPIKLQRLVKCHIVSSAIQPPASGATNRYDTRGGCGITFSNVGGTLNVNGANASYGMRADNGQIYPIDRVLGL